MDWHSPDPHWYRYLHRYARCCTMLYGRVLQVRTNSSIIPLTASSKSRLDCSLGGSHLSLKSNSHFYSTLVIEEHLSSPLRRCYLARYISSKIGSGIRLWLSSRKRLMLQRLAPLQIAAFLASVVFEYSQLSSQAKGVPRSWVTFIDVLDNMWSILRWSNQREAAS